MTTNEGPNSQSPTSGDRTSSNEGPDLEAQALDSVASYQRALDKALVENAALREQVERLTGELLRAQNELIADPLPLESDRIQTEVEARQTAERALREAQQEIQGDRYFNKFLRVQRERDDLRAALKAGVGTHGEVCSNPECEFLVQARAALHREQG